LKEVAVLVQPLEEMPEEADGPFLKEEQELIEAICRELTDFIERKYSEKALQESEKRLKTAAQIVKLGFWEWDIITGDLYWSDEGFRSIGDEPQSYKPSYDKFISMVHPEDVEFVEKQLNAALNNNKPYSYDFRYLLPNGEIRHFHMQGEVTYDKNGKAVRFVGTQQDISEDKKTEKIKRDLEQRRENFVWMTSHELRTPLTVISGYTDFLLKNINQVDQDQQNKILVTIQRNINRLMKLTEQVVQIAQFNNGIFEIKKVEFNICIFINEALNPYKTILKDQIDFEGCSIKTPVIIEGDKDRLLQVLDNLLNNAVEHTHPDNRLIKVNLEILANSILIKIIDNGAGIDQRNIKLIFEQFVSIETEYSVTGTGIGLHVSQKIIEAHKGTIIAQSEGVGRGATFTIELPR